MVVSARQINLNLRLIIFFFMAHAQPFHKCDDSHLCSAIHCVKNTAKRDLFFLLADFLLRNGP